MKRSWLAFLIVLLVVVGCARNTGAPCDCQPDDDDPIVDPIPDPNPDPDVSFCLVEVTDASPSLIVPGDVLTISGTGFGADSVVVIGGRNAAVIGTPSATTVTVTAPASWGYPDIAVDCAVAQQRWTFVGYESSVASFDLDDVIAELNATPEDSALRLPAGEFEGEDLELNTRKLYGAPGGGTILELTGDVKLYSRSDRVAALGDVSVTARDLLYYRGRLFGPTSLSPFRLPTFLLDNADVTLSGKLFGDVQSAILLIRGGSFDVDEIYTQGDQAFTARIEDAAFMVARDAEFTHGGGFSVARSTFDVGGRFVAGLNEGVEMAFVETTITADGNIELYIDESVAAPVFLIDHVVLNAGADLLIESRHDPLVIRASALSGALVQIDGDDYGAAVTVTDTSVEARVGNLSFAGYNVALSRVVLDSAGYVYLDSDGNVLLDAVTVTAATYIEFRSVYGEGVSVVGSSLDAEESIRLISNGAIIVRASGFNTDDEYVLFDSKQAGDITLDDITVTASDLWLRKAQTGDAENIAGVFTVMGSDIDVGNVRVEGPWPNKADVDVVITDNVFTVLGIEVPVLGFIVFTGNTGTLAADLTLEAREGELTVDLSGLLVDGAISYPNNEGLEPF
jgi:hypothetical protein